MPITPHPELVKYIEERLDSQTVLEVRDRVLEAGWPLQDVEIALGLATNSSRLSAQKVSAGAIWGIVIVAVLTIAVCAGVLLYAQKRIHQNIPQPTSAVSPSPS